MSRDNKCTNRYFDCLKNKLPDNWTNGKATDYYNRAFWERCKCEYGPQNPSKDTADKWYPNANETSKWTSGCSKCSKIYDKPRNYYFSYNPDDCKKCMKHGRRCKKHKHYRVCRPHKPCGDCHRCGNESRACPGLYQTPCSCCTDVPIVYRTPNDSYDCDNIVEFRIPVGSTKEQYMTKFSPCFIEANKFQCATLPAYNTCPSNIIDNRRECEFTESDQNALTKRGINNSYYAKKLIEEGKLTHYKHNYEIPMDLIGRTAYPQFGDPFSSGSTKTGLAHEDAIKYYFGSTCVKSDVARIKDNCINAKTRCSKC